MLKNVIKTILVHKLKIVVTFSFHKTKIFATRFTKEVTHDKFELSLLNIYVCSKILL